MMNEVLSVTEAKVSPLPIVSTGLDQSSEFNSDDERAINAVVVTCREIRVVYNK
jgi:hypothetical protein